MRGGAASLRCSLWSSYEAISTHWRRTGLPTSQGAVWTGFDYPTARRSGPKAAAGGPLPRLFLVCCGKWRRAFFSLSGMERKLALTRASTV